MLLSFIKVMYFKCLLQIKLITIEEYHIFDIQLARPFTN